MSCDLIITYTTQITYRCLASAAEPERGTPDGFCSREVPDLKIAEVYVTFLKVNGKTCETVRFTCNYTLDTFYKQYKKDFMEYACKYT